MLSGRQVDRVFAQLRTQLGWTNRGTHHAPRIHDLRHTFVVRRMLAWHADGIDVDQAMLGAVDLCRPRDGDQHLLVSIGGAGVDGSWPRSASSRT